MNTQDSTTDRDSKRHKKSKERPLTVTQIQLQSSSMNKYMTGANSLSKHYSKNSQSLKSHMSSIASAKNLKTSYAKDHSRNKANQSATRLKLQTTNNQSNRDDTREQSQDPKDLTSLERKRQMYKTQKQQSFTKMLSPTTSGTRVHSKSKVNVPLKASAGDHHA